MELMILVRAVYIAQVYLLIPPLMNITNKDFAIGNAKTVNFMTIIIVVKSVQILLAVFNHLMG
jgi:hypothetical protein